MNKSLLRTIGYLFIEISGLVLTFVLWYLQESDKPSADTQDEEADRLIVGSVTFLVILVINAFIVIRNEYFYKDRVIKDWASLLLHHIIDDNLAGDNYSIRASIYRPIGYWGALVRYIYHNSVHVFSPWWWGAFPRDMKATYLYLYKRHSSVMDEASHSVIKVTTKNEGSNGVVDYCFKNTNKHTPDYVSTASIKDITNLDETALISDHETSERVKKYMQETFMTSMNINLLRSMHSKPHKLYAMKLTDNKENVWGVLVIDTDDENFQKSITDEMSGVYSHYSKLFKNLFNSL